MNLKNRISQIIKRMPTPKIHRLPCVYVMGVDPTPDNKYFIPIAVETQEQKQNIEKAFAMGK